MPPSRLFTAVTLIVFAGCQGDVSTGTFYPEGPRRANPTIPEEVKELPPSVVPAPDAEIFAFLPRRIRRLSNQELENTLEELTGQDLDIVARFPEDTRQKYFRLNDAQIVDPLWATGISEVAAELANDLATRGFPEIVDCQDRDAACGKASVEDFAERAWRRPLTDEERAGLATLYDKGEGSGGFDAGVTWAIEGILQAPGFLYTWELGDGRTTSGTVVLSPWEVAAQLALVTTARPPDEALLAAAADASILESSVRAEHARRLLETSSGKLQMRELVMQWLGLDKLKQISKDANTLPEFMYLQGAIIEEAEDFIDHIVDNGDGVAELLGAAYTIVNDQRLAQDVYGTGQTGRIDLSATARRGILSHASFLAAHSGNDHSGPIERGVTILERILCVELVSPGELDIQVTPPPPDPNATTRERFSVHSADQACAGCHRGIDGVGFAFEHFDPIGRYRERENNKPVDPSGDLLHSEAAGTYPSSKEMIEAFATTETVRQCFARNVFGFASARDDEEVAHSFETLWAKDTPTTDRLDDALVVFIASELFLHRSPEP